MSFLVLLAVISLFASILHGLSGMGFPLLATTALSLAMPLTKTVALLAIPTLLINLWVVFAPAHKPAQAHSSSPPTIRPYLPLIIASVVGGVLGVRLLLFLPTVWLTLLLGITILLSSLHGIFSLKNKPLPKKTTHPPKTPPMLIAGFLAGLIGSATNAMSPILLFYLFSQSDDKTLISKVSNICYSLSKLLQIVLLWQTFLAFHRQDWALLFVLCVLAIAGVVVGLKFQQKISQLFFKKLIYGILFLLAIKMIWGSIGALF